MRWEVYNLNSMIKRTTIASTFLVLSIASLLPFSIAHAATPPLDDTSIVPDGQDPPEPAEDNETGDLVYIDNDNSSPDPTKTNKVFQWLRTHYGTMFQDKIYSSTANKYLSVDKSWYKGHKPGWRVFVYGDAGDIPANENSRTRYVGYEYTGEDYAENPRFHFDSCTMGTIIPRTVIHQPYLNSKQSLINTYKKHVQSSNYNSDTSLKTIMQQNLNYAVANLSDAEREGLPTTYTIADAHKERMTASDMIYDKYADPSMIALNQRHSSCYVRHKQTADMYANHIQVRWSNPETRIEYFHVATFPTPYTSGTVYEWNTAPVKTYDSFRLVNDGDDFEAYDLKVNRIGTNLSSVFFEVRNISNRFVNTRGMINASFQIYNDTQRIELYSFHPTTLGRFLPDWSQNQVRNTMVADNIDLSSFVNQKFKYTAEFNPDETYPERDYSNNIIEKSDEITNEQISGFKGSCFISYVGQFKSYSVLQVDKNGNNYCKQNVTNLSYAVDMQTIEAQYRGITAMWSSNTKGHYLHRAKIAAKNDTQEGNLVANGGMTVSSSSEKVTKKPVPSTFKVLGVTKLGKVIRSGRALEYNSAVVFIITAQSYTSLSDAQSRARGFYNEMHKDENMVIRGFNTSAGTNKILMQFNKGTKRNTEATAMRDTRRKNTAVAGAIENTYSETLGSVECVQIRRYTSTIKWTESMTTKNAGGKQKIQKGDFTINEDYQVGTNARQIYTSPDNPDGIYEMAFRFYFNPQRIDPYIPESDENCTTEPDLLIVQGNIYDDVRSKDVSDNNVEDFGSGW